MIHWYEELPFDFTDQTTDRIFTESALFFDIETTGFSPARTSVYLIGCAFRRGDMLCCEQFFAASYGEEAEVISAFIALTERYDTLITFNGIGFDIPYLKAKCEHFHFSDPFSRLACVDIFKAVSRIKFLLKLSSFKQKSIEAFLGISREDKFHGGELIQVYQEYVKSPSDEALFLLRQHNYEDVLDMPRLLPIFSYLDLLDGKFSILSLVGNEYTAFDGAQNKELLITLRNTAPVPRRVSCGYEEFYLTADGEQTHLRIRLFEGELKFFFDSYRDYDYLPDEDRAIHKSISTFVDKEHRKSATAATCYSKKCAIFLPQYEVIITPLFREKYKDKKTYFELTTEFIESEELQRSYIEHILRQLSAKKH